MRSYSICSALCVVIPLATAAQVASGHGFHIKTPIMDGSVKPSPLYEYDDDTVSPIAGDFTPLPPPIECDDFYASNGIACIFVQSVATKFVTDLTLGNVSMPDNNPTFVVDPPATIGPEGGWFSFRTLFNWTNTEDPIVDWQGTVQYYQQDDAGTFYVFQVE